MDLEKVRVVVRQAEVGYEGDAKADAGQIDEQVIAGQLDFRYKVQLFLLEQAVKKFAGHADFVQHQQRIA